MQTLESLARSTLRRFEYLIARVESLRKWQVEYCPTLIATYRRTGEALRQYALAVTADDFDSMADFVGWCLRIQQAKAHVIGIAVALHEAKLWMRNQIEGCS